MSIKLTKTFEIDENGNCSSCKYNVENVCISFGLRLKGKFIKLEVGCNWEVLQCQECKDFLTEEKPKVYCDGCKNFKNDASLMSKCEKNNNYKFSENGWYCNNCKDRSEN